MTRDIDRAIESLNCDKAMIQALMPPAPLQPFCTTHTMLGWPCGHAQDLADEYTRIRVDEITEILADIQHLGIDTLPELASLLRYRVEKLQNRRVEHPGTPQ